IDRHVLVDDPALHGLPGGLGVPLGGVHTLDQDLVLVGEDTGDARLLAGVLAGDHHHLVSSLQLHHRTSGASETILMNRRSRSSLATGPKIREPRGCWVLSLMTQALSSNLMYVPSGRRDSLRVRTTTALTTSPFFTVPPGVASFTAATITSPTPAYRRCDPPSTRMQSTSRAPVLSATLRRDSCWIIGHAPRSPPPASASAWTSGGSP